VSRNVHKLRKRNLRHGMRRRDSSPICEPGQGCRARRYVRYGALWAIGSLSAFDPSINGPIRWWRALWIIRESTALWSAGESSLGAITGDFEKDARLGPFQRFTLMRHGSADRSEVSLKEDVS